MADNLTIMNWNIEQLSNDKINISGMADAIARTVVSMNIDLLVILELRTKNVKSTMDHLTTALNNVWVKSAPGNDRNYYRAGFVSAPTGSEHYGFVIKDLNKIRPIVVEQEANDTVGLAENPLMNLDDVNFRTWPDTFTNLPNAYSARDTKRYLPLTDIYAGAPPSGRNALNFYGQALSGKNGYSLGRGFRLPCLAMFELYTGVVIPIVACHFGAVRGGKNHLAGGQIKQLFCTHIAQKFNTGGTIKLNVTDDDGDEDMDDDTGTVIEEIIFTGDYNVNFLRAGQPNLVEEAEDYIDEDDGDDHTDDDMPEDDPNYETRVYASLSPATANSGSEEPDALPGQGAIMQDDEGLGGVPLPAELPDLELKAANTSQGTILHHYHDDVTPTATWELSGACFDNFFFGGTELSANIIIDYGYNSIDACEVYDLPAQVIRPVSSGTRIQPGQIQLKGVSQYYWNKKGRRLDPNTGQYVEVVGVKNARAAPSLQRSGNSSTLTMNDRLIGTRFVSDHLPTAIEFYELL